MSETRKYLVTGTICRTIEARGATIDEAVVEYRKLADGQYPDSWEEDIVDDGGADAQEFGFIVGGCESCGRPILEGRPHNLDTEGIVWHKEDDPECRPLEPSR